MNWLRNMESEALRQKITVSMKVSSQTNEVLAINTKLPMLISKSFTTTNKLPPVELDLMITGSRV